MTVIGLQVDIAWEDKPANFAKVTALLERAQPAPGSLVVLPELFATGFTMNAERVAEDEDGPTRKFLSATARQWQSHVVAGAAMRLPEGGIQNQALVFGPEGECDGLYAKRRLFSPVNEQGSYLAGHTPLVFRWSELQVSLLICYDLRFPELFRQAAASHRPELFLVIANWPARRRLHWERLLRARAIENQAYVMGVNRTGADPETEYVGDSFWVDPHGEILADAGRAEGWVQGQPDLAALCQYRARLAFLNDLQP